MEQQKYDEAIFEYSNVQKYDKRNHIVYLNRSNVYMLKGMYGLAIKDIKKSIELNPNVSNSWAQRASLHILDGEYKEAEKAIKKALSLDPTNLNAMQVKIDLLKKQGKHTEVINQSFNDLRKFPDLSRTNANQIPEEQISEFISDVLDKSAKKDSSIGRALILTWLGKPKVAKAIYDSLISENIHVSESYFQRSKLYYQNMNFEKARLDLMKCLEFGDTDKELIHYNLGVVYEKLENFEKAKNEYSKVLLFNPKNAEALNNRGSSYMYLGDRKNALIDYNMAIAINPYYPEALMNRGQIYMDQNKYNLALNDFSNAINIAPTNGTAYFLRAQLHKLIGNEESARKDMLNFEQYGPSLIKDLE